jgi:hypothetical protein
MRCLKDWNPPPKKNAVHASKIPGTMTDYIGAIVILCPAFVEPSYVSPTVEVQTRFFACYVPYSVH